MLDIFLFIIGALFAIGGLIGCIIPAIPGPPLSFIALVLIEIADDTVFSGEFLLVMLLITIIVSVLDYLLPLFGIRVFGVTNYGMWGSIIGMVIGIIFFPPFGMILGMIIGAVVGELAAGKESSDALKAGLTSFLINIFLIILKLAASIIMGYYFFKEGISHLI